MDAKVLPSYLDAEHQSVRADACTRLTIFLHLLCTALNAPWVPFLMDSLIPFTTSGSLVDCVDSTSAPVASGSGRA